MNEEQSQLDRLAAALAQTDTITNTLAAGLSNVQSVIADLAQRIKDNPDSSTSISVLADKIIAQNATLTATADALLAVGKPAETPVDTGGGETPQP